MFNTIFISSLFASHLASSHGIGMARLPPHPRWRCPTPRHRKEHPPVPVAGVAVSLPVGLAVVPLPLFPVGSGVSPVPVHLSLPVSGAVVMRGRSNDTTARPRETALWLCGRDDNAASWRTRGRCGSCLTAETTTSLWLGAAAETMLALRCGSSLLGQ